MVRSCDRLSSATSSDLRGEDAADEVDVPAVGGLPEDGLQLLPVADPHLLDGDLGLGLGVGVHHEGGGEAQGQAAQSGREELQQHRISQRISTQNWTHLITTFNIGYVKYSWVGPA